MGTAALWPVNRCPLVVPAGSFLGNDNFVQSPNATAGDNLVVSLNGTAVNTLLGFNYLLKIVVSPSPVGSDSAAPAVHQVRASSPSYDFDMVTNAPQAPFVSITTPVAQQFAYQ